MLTGLPGSRSERHMALTNHIEALIGEGGEITLGGKRGLKAPWSDHQRMSTIS